MPHQQGTPEFLGSALLAAFLTAKAFQLIECMLCFMKSINQGKALGSTKEFFIPCGAGAAPGPANHSMQAICVENGDKAGILREADALSQNIFADS